MVGRNLRKDRIKYLEEKFDGKYKFVHHHCSVGWREDFILVTCPHHGEIITKFRNIKHRDFPCDACFHLNRRINEVLELYAEYHPEVYDIRTPPAETQIKFICKKHGGVVRNIRALMDRKPETPCHRCTSLNKHNAMQSVVDRYPNIKFYEDDYINASYPIKMECPIHGFKTRYYHHFRNSEHGCPECDFVSSESSNPFTRTSFVDVCEKNSEDCTGCFYIIKCTEENGDEFVKVGITSKTIKERYPNLSVIPYVYEVLFDKRFNPIDCFNMEWEMKRGLREFHYRPELFFQGSVTECFCYNKECSNIINKILNEYGERFEGKY